MSAGRTPMRATFWLLEAPDSLAEQSRRNPDGYGIATFGDDGSADLAKRPAAAYADELFAREAREEESATFVAHVRYASTGERAIENTHPFEQEGRVFAHNGHIGGLDRLEGRLTPTHRSAVRGRTDSERFFALITQETAAADGDVGRGIEAAVRWIAADLPVYALNFVLATGTELWALRYPGTNPLLMLERGAGGASGMRHFDGGTPDGSVRVRSGAMRDRATVVFASEQMDEDAGWRALEPGEMVRVSQDLEVMSDVAFPDPPAHQLRLEDLDPRAAASQGGPVPRPGAGREAPAPRP